MASWTDYPLDGPQALLDTLAPGSMAARFVVGSLILLYAVWTDLRERRVVNEVWLIALGFGAAFAVYDVLRADPPLVFFLLVPIVMGVAYLLWRLRLLFGGADAKCIMAFALLVPYTPAVAGGGAVYPYFDSWLPLAVTMLTNAVLVTLLVPLLYFLVNAARGDFHPVAMFLGTRVAFSRVLTEPVWVMEWVRPAPGVDAGPEGPSLADTTEDPPLDDDGLPPVDLKTLDGATVRLVYMPTRAGDYALNVARLKALKVDKVWATPKIPFMIPLFFGFVTAFLAGDLIGAAVFWLVA